MGGIFYHEKPTLNHGSAQPILLYDNRVAASFFLLPKTWIPIGTLSFESQKWVELPGEATPPQVELAAGQVI